MNIRFHTSILSAIREAEYRADDSQIKKLAETKNASDSVGETLGDDYFRVLLRGSLDAYVCTTDYIGEQGKRDAFESVHKHNMGIVTEAVVTRDIEADPEDSPEVKATKTKERQKRTNFARSAGSVLRRYLKAGGDLANLDPMRDGKAAVVRKAEALENPEGEAKASEKSAREKCMARFTSLMTALRQYKDEDEVGARGLGGEMVSEIETMLTG